MGQLRNQSRKRIPEGKLLAPGGDPGPNRERRHSENNVRTAGRSTGGRGPSSAPWKAGPCDSPRATRAKKAEPWRVVQNLFFGAKCCGVFNHWSLLCEYRPGAAPYFSGAFWENWHLIHLRTPFGQTLACGYEPRSSCSRPASFIVRGFSRKAPLDDSARDGPRCAIARMAACSCSEDRPKPLTRSSALSRSRIFTT